MTSVNGLADVLASPVMVAQIEAGKLLDWQMIPATVKMFKQAAEPAQRFGFVTVYKPDLSDREDGTIDVFVHSAGGHQWCDDGWSTPGVQKTDYLPPKGKIVFLNDIYPHQKGFRADKWVLATTSSFQAVVAAIEAKPVYRLCEWSKDGDEKVLIESRALNAIRERFPANGSLISYPIVESEDFCRFFRVLNAQGEFEVVGEPAPGEPTDGESVATIYVDVR